MITVTFEFKIDQKVVTPFGDDGIVSLLGMDGEGIQYYVKTRADDKWFKEKDLTAKE